MSETLISATELYTLVNEEFARLRPAACSTCKAPAPIRKFPPMGSNWQLAAARACPHGCRDVLREIESRLESQYRLKAPWSNQGNHETLDR